MKQFVLVNDILPLWGHSVSCMTISLVLSFLGISMHLKKPNSAKLVMQLSIGERRRTWASVEPGSVIFYELGSYGLLVNSGCPWFLWPRASACPVWHWTQTYSFSMLTNHQIRQQTTVSLVIADCHLIFLKGMWGYVWVNILTVSRGNALKDI